MPLPKVSHSTSLNMSAHSLIMRFPRRFLGSCDASNSACLNSIRVDILCARILVNGKELAKDGDHVRYTFKAGEKAQIEIIF